MRTVWASRFSPLAQRNNTSIQSSFQSTVMILSSGKKLLFAGLALVTWIIIVDHHQQQQQQQQQQQKYLRRRPSRNLSFRQPFGSVTIDFYRSYEETQFLFFKWRSQSISKARCLAQVKWCNFWYAGRINFVMGNVYDYDDVPHENANPGPELFQFATSENRDLGRISALYVKSFSNTINGLAIDIDVPLGGGDSGIAAATIITMSSIFDLPIGLNNLFGATLAHEIGHLVGFFHTAEGNYDGVIAYNECGLDLRYPQFNRYNTMADTVMDPVLGTTYQHKDWNARSNLMTPFTPETHIPNFYQIGIYKSDYEPVFDQITECWFSRAAS